MRMKFCKNCGTEAEQENQQFCKSCGFSLIEEDEPFDNNTNNQSIENERVMTEGAETQKAKKNKWWIYSLIALVLLLTIAHFAYKSYLDPTKQIEAMDKDFQNEDEKGFLSHFDYSSKTKANAKSFYNYIEEESWSDLRGALLKNVDAIKNDKLIDPVEDSTGNKLVKLIKEPVLGGLYNRVSFELQPIHVEVESEYEDIEFTSENETKKLDEKKPVFIGEFLPGEYKWSAVMSSKFGKIPFNDVMKIGEDASGNEETIELDLEPSFATLVTNNDNAKLLVIGKPFDFNFYEQDEIGPLPLDGSVTVQAEVTDNGQKHKTKVIKVNKETVDLNFDYIAAKEVLESKVEAMTELADENYDAIESFYQDYRKAYESDINAHIYSALAGYVIGGSALETLYKNYVTDFVGSDRISNHTNILTDLVAVNSETFTFNTREEYTFYSHKNETIEYGYNKKYTVIKSGDRFKAKTVDSTKVFEDKLDE